MGIQISYQPTRKESLAALRASRSWLVFGMPILGVNLLGMITFLWFLDRELTALDIGLFAYGIFIIAFPELWLRWIAFRLRHLTDLPVDMTFDADGLSIKSPNVESKVLWGLFKCARAKSEFWLLKISTFQTLPVPRRAFGPGQEDAFKSLLQKAGLVKS